MVFRILAVQDILTNILPFSFLKREQIRAALRYLKGEIAGDDLIANFNQEFDLGKRRIRTPMVSVPLRRLDAAKKARKEAFQRMHSLD